MKKNKFRALKILLQKYVYSDDLPLEGRMLNMIFLVGLCTSLAALISRIIMGTNIFFIAVVLSLILSILGLLFIGNRYKVYTLCRRLTLIVICYLFLPLIFFTLGGMKGYTSAYFVLSIVLIFLITQGKIRVICVTLHLGEIALCYYVSSLPFFAGFFAGYSNVNLYLDHLQTLAVVGIYIGVITICQTKIYALEREKADRANADLFYRDQLLRVVNQVAEMLLAAETVDLEKTLNKAMDVMARCAGADRMYIWKNRIIDGKLCYEQQYEWLKEGVKTRVLSAEPGRAYIEYISKWEENFFWGRCVNSRVSSLSPEEQETLNRYGIKSILVIPIILRDKFRGFVSFDDCSREREFSEEDVNILRSGSLLLANALVRDARDAALNTRLRQQELMSDISQSFISRAPMGDLIRNALKQTGEFIRATRVLIAVADKDSEESHPVYAWFSGKEWEPEPSKKGFNNLINSAFPKEVPEMGSVPTIFCNDIFTDEGGKYRILEIADLKSFIWAPLYVDNWFWGLLSIEECVQKRAWTESDAQLVSIVSSAISGAVTRDIMEKARSAALEQAIQASQAKGNFLSNMSHEMRTPMNAIIGMTAIGKAAEEMEKKNYALGKIEDASSHLLGVINDILDMSKIEANKLELSPVSFEFEKMFQKVVNVINFRVDERRQSFYVTIDRKIPQILIGDDQRLAQVITNLLSNAVKFTPEEGVIRLDAHYVNDAAGLCTIRIEVTDTGIGISPEQQARLFNSFEQAESSTTRKFGGTGLGLAISKRIVELMGGQIWIKSELGKGAAFIFTVKLKRGVAERRALLSPGINWSNVKIQVTDDESEVRQYFSDIAQRFDIHCDTAGSGEEALRQIETNGPYDIYFIDWKMPGMNGMELARRIRELIGEKSVVTMISGAEWNSIADDAKAAGVDRFLAKPLFPSAIADLINECLGVANAAARDKKKENNIDHFEGHRVLLAEDVEINREIVLALLEPTALDIECVENGADALERFRKDPDRYDMIFMDVQMPEMDGYEATRRIREFEREKYFYQGISEGIPIVAMTANVFREDIEKALTAGMNDHVGKPLDFEEVLTKLRKYLPPRPLRSTALMKYSESGTGNSDEWKYGVAWNPELVTGNYNIDSQHKQIFRILSNLVDASINGQSPKVLKETLDFLTEYTLKHFTDEEALQLTYRFPNYTEHRQAHDDFKKTVEAFCTEFDEKGSSPELWEKVASSIIHWLVKHIKQEDFKIADFIREIEGARK